MCYVELHNFLDNICHDHWETNIKKNEFIFFKLSLDYITENFKKTIEDCGLEIDHATIFQKPAGAAGVIHTDLLWNYDSKKYDICNTALNVNLTKSNNDSVMLWFKNNIPAIEPETMENPYYLNGLHYGNRRNRNYKYNSDFTLLDKLTIVKPTLVKTGIPHLVENYGSQERICLSIRFKNNPTIEECAAKLKEFI